MLYVNMLPSSALRVVTTETLIISFDRCGYKKCEACALDQI